MKTTRVLIPHGSPGVPTAVPLAVGRNYGKSISVYNPSTTIALEVVGDPADATASWDGLLPSSVLWLDLTDSESLFLINSGGADVTVRVMVFD